MKSSLAFLAVLLDALLGKPCRIGCGQRVFPRDIATHEAINHDGDATP